MTEAGNAATARQQGMTIVELLLGMTLLVVLFGIGASVTDEMNSTFQLGVANADLDTSLQRVTDRIWSDLQDSGAGPGDGTTTAFGDKVVCLGGSTVLVDPDGVADLLADGATLGPCEDDIDPPRTIDEHMVSHPEAETTESSEITFRTRVDFDAWSNPVTYRLTPEVGETADNGVDDDGDGVVDEQELVRVQNGESIVVARNITRFLCNRAAGDYRVDVTIEVSRVGSQPGEVLRRTRTATVRLRNRPD